MSEIILALMSVLCFFFFQAEDGIRDAQESRGLGDVYKRQAEELSTNVTGVGSAASQISSGMRSLVGASDQVSLSLIHI